MRRTDSRPGIGEVVGSVSMLAITIALLAGTSAVALLSIHNAAELVSTAGEQRQREAGMLVDVVGTQSNSSGTYVWLYDYGWESAPVQAVFINGETASWSFNCGGDWSGSLCIVSLPAAEKGQVTIVMGGVSLGASV
ncbi:MAG: hypothetical protein LYZ69_00640 [Nitrososphaerales archaeon]|nr:hypothetical protein [Nitrososphaerales archaeon]